MVDMSYNKIVGRKVLIKPYSFPKKEKDIVVVGELEEIGSKYLAEVVDYNEDLVPTDLKEIGFARGKIIRHDGNAFKITLDDVDYLMTGFNHIIWIYN